MMISGKNITKALIIAQPWVNKIFSDDPDEVKDWEMRSSGTKIRGDIGIIEKGTGLIVGITTLIDSIAPLSLDELIANKHRHRVDYENNPDLAK